MVVLGSLGYLFSYGMQWSTISNKKLYVMWRCVK